MELNKVIDINKRHTLPTAHKAFPWVLIHYVRLINHVGTHSCQNIFLG
jgi:hypothetical protein